MNSKNKKLLSKLSLNEDDSLKFTITTDYEKVDLEALSNAGLIDSGDYISLDKTVDGLKDKGMTCEEK